MKMKLVICRDADKKSFLSVFSEGQSFHIQDDWYTTLPIMTFLTRKFSKFQICLPRQQRLDS